MMGLGLGNSLIHRSAPPGGGGTPAPSGPVIVSAPTINLWDGLVGNEATSAPAVWDNPGYTITYQWYANGSPISGETGTTYVQTESTAGMAIKIREQAENGAMEVSFSDSATHNQVALREPNVVGSYVISYVGSGTGLIGDRVEVDSSPGTVDLGNPPAGADETWNGIIDTSMLYLAAGDIGGTITRSMSATNSQGADGASSNGLTPLAAAAPSNTTLPVITSNGGSGLICSDGVWTGNAPQALMTFSRKWFYDDYTAGFVELIGETGNEITTAFTGDYYCEVTATNQVTGTMVTTLTVSV